MHRLPILLDGRLVCYKRQNAGYRHKELLQSKVRYGAVILVDGGEGKMEKALSTSRILLNVMKTEFKGLIYFSGTDSSGSSPPELDIALQGEIEKLARVLCCNSRS